MDEESTFHPDINHPYLAGIESHVPMLKALSGSLKGRHYQLAEKMVIGRDPECGILIQEREVSRQHAAIVKKGERFLVCDLGSTNGIYVNNLKLDRAVLKQGDILQIGSCVFQFFWC